MLRTMDLSFRLATRSEVVTAYCVPSKDFRTLESTKVSLWMAAALLAASEIRLPKNKVVKTVEVFCAGIGHTRGIHSSQTAQACAKPSPSSRKTWLAWHASD